MGDVVWEIYIPSHALSCTHLPQKRDRLFKGGMVRCAEICVRDSSEKPEVRRHVQWPDL